MSNQINHESASVAEFENAIQDLAKKINDLEQNLISKKDVLTFQEAAKYTGLSRSYLYKLTSTSRIPHYKPNGKMIYFNRAELENYLLTNQEQAEQIESQAATYVTLHKRGGAA
jgi:excisionase family DNA binding protein